MTTMTATARRYYAVTEIRDSRLSAENRYHVQVFTSRRDRAAFVTGAELSYEDAPLHGYGERRAVDRSEAASIMRQIMESAHGGRQAGYWALSEVAPSSIAR